MNYSKKNPKVSVIIPVFNGDKYIERLLKSLLRQSFNDFEVICVDNSSTDRTREIASAFCENDPRFFCVTIEHGGAGVSRNKGLDLARGKYIIFLDVDDEYNKDLLKEMVSAAEKHQADEVFCLYHEYNYRTHTRSSNHGFDQRTFPDNVPVRTADISNLYQHTSWRCTNTLFRKEIIDRYNLRYSETRVSEDVFFIKAYPLLTKKIVGVHKNLLTVRRFIDEQSLTSTRWRHTEEAVTVMLELYEWLNENGLYEKYRETYLWYFFLNIRYNGGFPLNPNYVEALTDALCTCDIFSDMSEEEFYEKFWKDNDTELLIDMLRGMGENAAYTEERAQHTSNLLLTILSVEERAKEKYGRTLNLKEGRVTTK